ncbi:DUF2946 family protein [Luteimonas sp. A611]
MAAPAVSRVLAASMPDGALILMEMCTKAGMKLIDVSPFVGDVEQPANLPSADDDACGYCALTTPAPLVLALLFALLLWAAQLPALRGCTRIARPLRNLRGLGSQGPPLLS